jgi:GMP synthase-like glutamine amidotransferase
MTDTWTILQHVEWEGPGLIAAEAQGRGLHTDIRRLDLGAGLPRPDDVEGLVVMGGPIGAYETDKHPSLAAECNLIAELVRRDCPVLGVCLGAQLLRTSARGESVSWAWTGNRFRIRRADGGGEARCAVRTKRTVRPCVPVAWRHLRST